MTKQSNTSNSQISTRTTNGKNKTMSKQSNTSNSQMNIAPMGVKNVGSLTERLYRETKDHQWLREFLQNSIEAGATRAHLGIEWGAVASRGVYRRVYSDDGHAMDLKELTEFFANLGDGSKAIGGRDENFGVGAKVSALPWNKFGLTIISRKDGRELMIRLAYDPDTHSYGPMRFDTVNAATGIEQTAIAVPPFLDTECGVDWSKVMPDFIREKGHGTCIVMMGNTVDTDTVLGAPGRDEWAIKSASKYLNERYFELPIKLTIDELNHADKSMWPRSEAETRKNSGSDEYRPINTRKIEGAENFITYPKQSFESGRLASSGTTVLTDGTEVDHYLWDGKRPEVGDYATRQGYIAVRYGSEIYHHTDHHNSYRSWSVPHKSVRRNLTLIVRPRQATSDQPGAYARGDRSGLLYCTRTSDGLELPMLDWAEEWADNMPDDVRDALRKAVGTGSGTIKDASYLKRLAAKFNDKWKIDKVDTRRPGDMTTNGEDGTTTIVSCGGGGNGNGNGGGGGGGGGNRKRRITVYPEYDGPIRGHRTQGEGGIPRFEWVDGAQFDDGVFATWEPSSKEYPRGVVFLNQGHPVIEAESKFFAEQYPNTWYEDVVDAVHDCYGESAVAAVAHSEHLKTIVSSDIVDNQMRDPYALTMSLLGLIAEEAMIAERIRELAITKKKKAA